MIKITKKNINSKFDFFKKICIEECIDYLKDKIPPVKGVHVIENDDNDNSFLDDIGGALCTVKYNDINIYCEIYISGDILEYYKKYKERDRREKFLRSLGVPVNKYSLFLIVLLHEFGHSNLVKMFYDAGIIDDYNIFDTISDSLSSIFEKREETLLKWEFRYKNNELTNIVNGIESQSDIFARDNFLPLWKKLNKILRSYKLDEL
mgnify:CR=1 FL=1